MLSSHEVCMCYNLSIQIDSVLELGIKQAIHLSGKDIPPEEVTIGIRGDLKVGGLQSGTAVTF
jgi:hypothetical protein